MVHDGDPQPPAEVLEFPALEVFLTALRREGVPVGVLEIERLRRVFAAEPDLRDERTWYRLLAGLLVKNEVQRIVFDRVFANWQASWPAYFRIPESRTPPAGGASGARKPKPSDGKALDPDTSSPRAADGNEELGPIEPDSPETAPDNTDSPVFSLLIPGLARWWPAALPVLAVLVALLGGVRTTGTAHGWVLWSLGLAMIGWVVWREYRARRQLQASPPGMPAGSGPGYLPYLPRSEGSGFLSPEEVREIVWSVGRYIAEDQTHALDMDTTVARTAAEGNVFTPCYERAVYPREVWLWEDGLSESPLPEQLSSELIRHLGRAGLPVRHGIFRGIPREIHWEDGELFEPVVVEGFRQQAIVLILTDGEIMGEAHHSDWSHHRLHRLLHDLGGWQRLAVVDVAEGRHGLEALLAPHGVVCLHPWQIPGFMASGERATRRRPPLFEVTGDLRAWAAALALSPREPDLKLAQRLRERLGLRAESWQLEALLQWEQTLDEGLRFEPRQRRIWLDWLVRAECRPGGIVRGGTLERALDFWWGELDREEQERASRGKTGLFAWENSPAARQLAREKALLALWRDPDEATDALYALWQNEDQSAAVADALAGYAPRDPEFAERVDDAGNDPVLLLPWSMAEHCRKRTARRLTRMGIGAGLRATPRGRFPVRGRSWLAVGVACGLGGMGAIRLGGVIGGLGAGVSVGLAVGLWAWCDRKKLLYRGRPQVEIVDEEPGPKLEPPFQHPLTMVEIPGGTFLMGSPADDEQAFGNEHPQHEVTISPFLMSETTVTRALYREHMDKQPKEWQGDEDDGQLPANHVSWFDAVAFCNRLSERADLVPCYDIDNKKVTWNREADGYRLPTEAEWEYACRAGTTTRWFWGDEEAGIDEYAWYGGNAGDQVRPVAQKEPNPWGLYDMAGNVWEWCWDWFGEYPEDPQTDPDGPPTGVSRVLRGGAFHDVPGGLRAAYRGRVEPEFRRRYGGFRVVRGSRRQP